MAAQNLSPRHERALEVYALRFEATLDKLESVSKCPIHQLKDASDKDNEHFTWWIDEVLKAVRSSHYQQVFAEMRKAYIASITGRFGESFSVVEKLMLDLGIDQPRSDRLDKVLYFRGRKGRFGREDLYHIPFTKRHCISNQRYSVTGQPLLYLGLSILDVAFELGADPQAIDDYSFNTYFLKDANAVRVLDLGNSLFQILRNNVVGLAREGMDLKGMATKGTVDPPGAKNDVDAFIRFTIAATCSFRRRSVTTLDAFAPEYVLPQTLAHWARQAKFDGILYTSTRVDTRKWRVQKGLKLNRYLENIAFFTDYDPSSDADHDLKLLQQFEISPPIQISDIKNVADEVMDAHRIEVAKDGKSNSLTHIGQRAGYDLDAAFGDLVHVDEYGNETPYAETKPGRLQRYLQFLFLMSRLVEY
ncbi:MAG: RES domain-containing protein [Verrucomicrobiaceae bacterium]|nr:RES domain-containing protein [Verrucomicrobiaceae bacterium]